MVVRSRVGSRSKLVEAPGIESDGIGPHRRCVGAVAGNQCRGSRRQRLGVHQRECDHAAADGLSVVKRRAGTCVLQRVCWRTDRAGTGSGSFTWCLVYAKHATRARILGVVPQGIRVSSGKQLRQLMGDDLIPALEIVNNLTFVESEWPPEASGPAGGQIFVNGEQAAGVYGHLVTGWHQVERDASHLPSHVHRCRAALVDDKGSAGKPGSQPGVLHPCVAAMRRH